MVANVNPEMITWLRNEARLTPADCATLAGFREEDLMAWEEGREKPTVNQARHLAEFLGSHFTVLFRSRPRAELNPPLQDNRRGNVRDPALERIVALECRRVWAKQIWLREVEANAQPDLLRMTAKARSDEALAEGIRNAIGLGPEDAMRERDRYATLNAWIHRFEQVGVLVFATKWRRGFSVESKFFRGAAFYDEYFPAVLYNSKDAVVGRIFTIAHEVAHLCFRQAVINNYSDEINSERRANAVAAGVLLPRALLEATVQVTTADDVPTFLDQLGHWSDRLHVSREVIARRLLTYDVISQNLYDATRQELVAQYGELASKAGSSGGDYYKGAVKWAGRRFSQIVLSEYRSGALAPGEASQLLGVKVNNFEKFSKELFKGEN